MVATPRPRTCPPLANSLDLARSSVGLPSKAAFHGISVGKGGSEAALHDSRSNRSIAPQKVVEVTPQKALGAYWYEHRNS